VKIRILKNAFFAGLEEGGSSNFLSADRGDYDRLARILAELVGRQVFDGRSSSAPPGSSDFNLI
jgi:hypothetical protein